LKFLFLFMDGVGLGSDNPRVNPLARVEMPNLAGLLGGRKLTASSAPLESERASLVALDAVMGVGGLPQSATGQASLLTGRNTPQLVGEHFGPKPNQAVRDQLAEGNLFSALTGAGYSAALLNAYPAQYFEAIKRGKRLYSSIPQAVVYAGISLNGKEELFAGEALSADFTAEGWRTHLDMPDTPVTSPQQAGRNLAKLAASYDLAFFEYWPSDYAGHRQNWDSAAELLEQFDKVLGGLLSEWDDQQGLILLTSDHGNLEALDTRRHTANPVPGLVIGAPEMRRKFVEGLRTLADVTPAILQFYPGAGDQIK
jgi:hypothetical protein